MPVGKVTAELGAVLSNGRPAQATDAIALLSGGSAPNARTWVDDRVALAWTGSAEVAATNELVLALDGRLDNRTELAERFPVAAHAATAELLAVAWRNLGEELVDLIVGDIAAIVVERESGRVCAFRDLCGGRALHVAHDHGRLMIATEWSSLSRSLPRREPDPEWFAGSLNGNALDPAATPYVGIRQVLPGHVAAPGSAGWRQVRRANWHVPVLRDRRPGAYAERFREIFDEAVSCRISHANHLGVSLSGGLDSTSVMVTAAALRPDLNRTALCLPMSEEAGDERALQRLVAKRSEARLRWVDFSHRGPFGPEGPTELFERLGGPPAVTNWFFGDALANSAREAGIDVALDGEEADGCLGGSYMYLADLFATGRWLRWRRETRMLRDRGAFTDRAMLRSSIQFASPPRLRLALERRRIGRHPFAPAPIIASRLRERVRLEDRIEPGLAFRTWHPGRAFRMTQSAVGTIEQVALIFTSVSEPWRRNGVSLTHPWSDRRVMSFCMGLPYEHVCDAAGQYKIVLRQAMSERLPQEVLSLRRKADLSEGARNAARGPELKYVQEGLRMARRQGDWFDPDVVNTFEEEFESGGSEGMAIRIATLAWWLRWLDAA